MIYINLYLNIFFRALQYLFNFVIFFAEKKFFHIVLTSKLFIGIHRKIRFKKNCGPLLIELKF